MTPRSWLVITLSVLLANGCCKIGDDKKAESSGPAVPGAPTAAPADKTATSPKTDPTASKPAEGQYSMSTIKAIADNCAKAHVVMATAPVTEKGHYPWTWTRQAVIAHPEFKANGGTHPKVPGEVLFQQFDSKDGKAKILIAHCADGGTCNKLAAMYRAVVPSSRPQPLCGEPGNVSGEPMPVLIPHPGVGNEDDMPDAKDIVALCARLGVCTIHVNPATTGDPGIECQKAPSRFKTACALKKPCAAVVECANK